MNPFYPSTSPAPSDVPVDRPWGALVVLALSIICLLVLYRFSMRRLYRYLVAHAHKEENAFRTSFVFRYSFMAIAVLTIIAIFGKSLVLIGLSLAFISTMLAWALRDPIMNLAGWLMLISVRPYRVGDRVILAGNIGVVKDISIMYTLLEQVGGTIGGEEKSGRALLIPNMHLFGWTIVNYTRDEQFILDEVPVRVTYDSNIERAEQILIADAREVLGHLVDETGLDPYVRHEFMASGIVSRVRYRVPPHRRQEISSKIVDRIFASVNPAPDVRFCYEQHVGLMTALDDRMPLPPQHPHFDRQAYQRGAAGSSVGGSSAQ